MFRLHFAIVFIVICLISCRSGETEDTQVPEHELRKLPAMGKLVRSDTIREARAIFMEEAPRRERVGDPVLSSGGKDYYTVGEPEQIEAGIPRICTPGLDTFRLPKVQKLEVLPVLSGVPEIVVAKDPYIQDHNPANFSTYTKLQGLQHDAVACILQDQSGHLWFGTLGGVSKFDGKSFYNYTDKEGLSNHNVRTMLQDRSGNIWFGTSGGGVTKFDGKHFFHYTSKDGLANNIVMSILEDRSGNIWFGTDGGVSRYDGKSFTTYTDKEGLVSNIVWSVLEDRDGNLWFGTYGGVSKYNGKTFANFTEAEGLPSNIVTSVTQDQRGNIWFGTFAGLSKYDGRYFVNYTEKQGLPVTNIWALRHDKKGNIWIGSSGEGLVKFDGESFTHYTDQDGLADNNVMALFEDKNENLWIGTYSGASRYDGNLFTNFTRKDGLIHDQVRSVLEDREGGMWFGTLKGLSRYRRTVFANYDQETGLPGSTIWSLAQDRAGKIWIGSDAGVSSYDGEYFVNYNESQGLVNNMVWSVMQDRGGDMWFATEAGVSRFDGESFTNYTEEEGLVNNFVTCMLQDRRGNMWFGTYGGLSRFDGRQFISYKSGSGLIHPSVLSMAEDRDGNLWIGTEGGLSRFDGKHFINFSERDGLSNKCVLSTLFDRKGNLWMGTRFGLCKLPASRIRELNRLAKAGAETIRMSFDKPSGTDVFFKSYGYYDGFLGIGVNGGKTLYESSDGTIWIGANEKLVAYHPEGDKADIAPPKVELTGIQLFTESVNWSALAKSPAWSSSDSPGVSNSEQSLDTTLIMGNGVRLSDFFFDGILPWSRVPLNLNLAYYNNYLTFHFTGVTQHRSKKVRYQYKLEGIDKNWSIPTASAEAAFGNIPHGDYAFLLKAINSQGVSSGIYRYSFSIRPPWWQTNWAYAAYLMAFSFSIFSFIRVRTANLRKRQKELEQKIEQATHVIRKQKDEVEEQRDQINEARKRSDELLENILPSQIAAELKANGEVKPVYRECVSVLFTDFVGFTPISEMVSPEVVVSMINRYFTGFDEIVSRFGVEKIKTIGDSYMLVSGVPNEDAEHAVKAVKTGLAMLDFVRNLNVELKEKGLHVLELRMGIHSGPAVAGIVGLKKFQYDIWGDTVNTASRMESYGESGRINISEQTFEFIKHAIPTEFRGEFEVKGKGKVKMYFVRGTQD